MKLTIVLTTLIVISAQGLLQVNKIEENSGYGIIRVRKVEIVNSTNTVLHIINPSDILEVVGLIESNVNELDVDNKEILKSEIKIIKSKIKTIMPNTLSRNKRGLINIVGTTYKWLFGVMDNDDREEILEHLRVTDENSHNAIETLNKQISINTHLNESIEIIRKAINNDRINIERSLKDIKTRHNEIARRLLYADQMLKLKSLENKITLIQDNIASAKNNIIHPGVLSVEEIDKFNIDFYKLKLLRMGIMSYHNNSLVIAIKVPTSYILTDLKIITPMPNDKFLEIDETNELVVTLDNVTYSYKENSNLKELQESKNCVCIKNCKLKYNNETVLEVIDDDLIIVKNSFELKLKQKCDEREITLNGNHLINFYNCEISLFNKVFYNEKTTVQDKFFYPSNGFKDASFDEKINFEEIKINQFKNIKEIKELKFHKNVSHYLNVVSLILVIIISVPVLYYIIHSCKKNNSNNMKVEFKLNPDSTETVESGPF